MKKTFLESAKERLIERRLDIVGYDEESSDINTEKDISRAKDAGDEALEISMEQLESSIRTTEMDELKLIDEALKRIDSGRYGICIDCENKISENRLACFPYAARCIICQEKFEG